MSYTISTKKNISNIHEELEKFYFVKFKDDSYGVYFKNKDIKIITCYDIYKNVTNIILYNDSELLEKENIYKIKNYLYELTFTDGYSFTTDRFDALSKEEFVSNGDEHYFRKHLIKFKKIEVYIDLLKHFEINFK